MVVFAYRLEKYDGRKSRHTCPSCKHKRQFVRYVDNHGAYIADYVGRCNRESKCGYHMKPRDYLQDNLLQIRPLGAVYSELILPTQYIPSDTFKRTLGAYERNTFVRYLYTIFDAETVQRLISSYRLGTTRDGSCIFWQIDVDGRVRTGKVIRFNMDGHRIKEVPPYYIHKMAGIAPIKQCLFGLHLPEEDPGRVIALVEGEKTAVIMAGLLPGYTWMATGGKRNLRVVDALIGKRVSVFPDTDAFDEWTERLTPYGFNMSNALQEHVKDPSDGYDLADFIMKIHPKALE